MGFNANDHVAAQQTWALTIGPRTWKARPVSVEAMLMYQATCAGASLKARREALYVLLRHAFPRTLRYWWLGDPVEAFKKLSPALQAEAQRDFFPLLMGVPPHLQRHQSPAMKR